MSRSAPQSVEEALARARDHGRRAAAESIAALQALVEAGALSRGPLADDDAIATLRSALERAHAWIDPDGGRDAASVLAGISEVLDEEILRWEEKSREDPEARSILRAFLAVREVLWELAAREADKPEDRASPAASDTAPRTRRAQRVTVDG